ncbi:MAG TPA: M23 family metallopeptidase, partial [Desulfobacteraceae bacterium]|nr:M23 family metallopeptidase [Desulfobacteraceae bacterium]
LRMSLRSAMLSRCCRGLSMLGFLLVLAWMPACAPSGIYHTIQPGQTLYRIAKTYQISEAELARVNRINDPTKLIVGHKLYIPGATRPRQVDGPQQSRSVATSPARSAPSSAAQTAPATANPPAAEAARKKTLPAPSAPPKKAAAPAPLKKGTFSWPVKGKVVGRFGPRGDTNSKGIEISCREGESVIAAAPGKVIYSGRGIRGYGNLIIIEHADDYFTVYGYNKQNLAKTNDFVGQGDQVALCGEPQNSQSSRLHFEIRKGKSAVDPIFYLP